jgi:methionyl-tRNA formyltransferase
LSVTFEKPMNQLSVIFMGTPDLARVSLGALLSFPAVRVMAAVTQPDRPKGRDLKLQPSPVKQRALEAGLPVLQPERARNEDFIAEVRRLGPELIAVAAYGQILPQAILDIPRYGCLNVHTSLLPKYRGAAPIQWAVLRGDAETGVTIMKMNAGMDTGDILSQEITEITVEDNAQTLHDRLAQIGADLLVRTIPDYVSGKVIPRPQPGDGVSLAPKIKKQDGEIDWTQSAGTIWNRVRALVPWPGAQTFLQGQPNPMTLKIWRVEPAEASGPAGTILEADKTGILVACGQNAVRILELQREGGRRLSAAQFLAGHPLTPGQTFLSQRASQST